MPHGAQHPSQRTPLILVAQILMVVKGAVWLIAGMGFAAVGIFLVVHGGDLHPAPGSPGSEGFDGVATGLAGLAAAFAIMAGAFGLAIGVADIVLGVTLGSRSNIARWFTVVLNSVAGVIAVLGIVGQAGNHRGTVGGAVVLAVWLAVNLVIFYALVIDEHSRQVFN